jgi:hypothetical protein
MPRKAVRRMGWDRGAGAREKGNPSVQSGCTDAGSDFGKDADGVDPRPARSRHFALCATGLHKATRMISKGLREIGHQAATG